MTLHRSLFDHPVPVLLLEDIKSARRDVLVAQTTMRVLSLVSILLAGSVLRPSSAMVAAFLAGGVVLMIAGCEWSRVMAIYRYRAARGSLARMDSMLEDEYIRAAYFFRIPTMMYLPFVEAGLWMSLNVMVLFL